MLIGLLLFMGNADSVQAGTSSTNYYFSVPMSPTDWSADAAIEQFNPDLGTLESVTLTYTGTMESTLLVSNSATGPAFGSFTEQLTFNAGQNALMTDKLVFGIMNLPSDSLTNFAMESDSQSVSMTYTNSLLSYLGTGEMQLPVSTSTSASLRISGASYKLTQATEASLVGEVTYDYVPTHISFPELGSHLQVPEPGVDVLMLTGGVWVFQAWYRSRRED